MRKKSRIKNCTVGHSTVRRTGLLSNERSEKKNTNGEERMKPTNAKKCATERPYKWPIVCVKDERFENNLGQKETGILSLRNQHRIKTL